MEVGFFRKPFLGEASTIPLVTDGSTQDNTIIGGSRHSRLRQQSCLECSTPLNGWLLFLRLLLILLDQSGTQLIAAMKTTLLRLFLVLVTLTAKSHADIVIDDFNTNRTYAPCCGEYGTYDSFTNNITQSGGGTLAIGGNATDNGGFYREGFGNVLWNFTGPTNLVLSLRARAGNTATNLLVTFRDVFGVSIMFRFSLAGLSTNSFTNLIKTLRTPDWTNDHQFAYSHVSSLDVYGEYAASDNALRVELDSLIAVGPVLEFGPPINLYRDDPNIVLTWQTNSAAAFVLQSATNLAGPWTNEATASITGSVHQAAFRATNGLKFYRLMNTNGSSFAGPSGKAAINWLGGVSESTRGGDWNVPTPLYRIKAIGPPPIITYTSNFIDVASYSGRSTNHGFHEIFYPTPGDFDIWYTLDFSDHTGGSANYRILESVGHSGTTGNPWIRTSNNVFTYQDNFYASSNTWLRTQAGYTEPTGNASTNPTVVARPTIPFAHVALTTLLESFGDTNVGGSTGGRSYAARQDDTQLHLHTGQLETNEFSKWVLLSVTASAQWPVYTLYAVVDVYDAPPLPQDGSVTRFLHAANIPFSNITCRSTVPNADNKIFLPHPTASTFDATPFVTPDTNFFFSVSIIPHPVVPLTRAFHPLFDQPPSTVPRLTTLRLKYFEGSKILANDAGVKIPDNDSSVAFNNNETSLYRNDDAPAYVEFRIAEGPMTTNVYSRTFQSVFTPPWHDQKYLDIVTQTAAFSLLGNAQANIKQVKTIGYNGKTLAAVTAPGLRSTILADIANPVTVIHEFGHSCRLEHRGETNGVGQNLNPGNGGNAVMDPNTDLTNVKINRYERDVINTATQ